MLFDINPHQIIEFFTSKFDCIPLQCVNMVYFYFYTQTLHIISSRHVCHSFHTSVTYNIAKKQHKRINVALKATTFMRFNDILLSEAEGRMSPTN